MTTEDDFNAMLDANPDDHVTRLVFADWLEERGDERADGYRALARRRMYPAGLNGGRLNWLNDESWDTNGEPWLMPRDWWELLDLQPAGALMRDFAPHTRQAAEEGAIRAFSKLPAPRRAALLAAEVTR